MEVIIGIIVVVVLYNLLFSSSSSSSSNNNRNNNYPSQPNRTTNTTTNQPHRTTSTTINQPNRTTSTTTRPTTLPSPRPPVAPRPIQNPIIPVNTFQPNRGITFKNSNEIGLYKWYSIYNYYPVNRFSYNDLSQEDINARRHVYNFKDGTSPKFYAELFASALINKYGSVYLKDKILLIIPASSKERTKVRFLKFCEHFCEASGMINGYNYFTNNEIVRNAAHGNGNRNYDINQYLILTKDLSNKDIFVIDDVRTSGSSSNSVFNFLNEKNVKSVTFIYLAKTVSIN
jgi:hypothetical protein